MTKNWWNLAWDVAAANVEAQRVITLRMMKLAKGGPEAQKEAHKMVKEKLVASMEAASTFASGGSPGTVVRRYRTIMRANARRLTRSKARHV
jgi:hypothetical protein